MKLPTTKVGRALARRDVPLAVASGLLLALSAAPFDHPALALGSPALFYVALTPTSGQPGARRSFGLGLLVGVAVNLIALGWIVDLLRTFGRFPLVAALPTAALLFAAQALPFALTGLATTWLRRFGAPAWLAFCVAWQLSFASTPALFPWRPAAPMTAWPEWVQLAELGGASLLDLLLALGAVAAVEALRRRRLRPALLALVVLSLPPLYGAIRLPQVEAERARAPRLRVGVVQPNVGIFEKHDPANFHPQLRALRAATAALEAQGAELVVWPESAYPFPLRRGLEREPMGPTAIHRDGVRGPVIFGALTMRGRCERYNSVVELMPDGRITGVADKVRLLAFGEFIPLWSWLTPLHRYFPCAGLRAGEGPGRLQFGGAGVDVLNCFEDVPSDYARTVVSPGPSWLLNVTNDAWFGDTSEPHLHEMVARLRAVETRRDLVRAVNTGVSAHVTGAGEEVVRTATFERASFIADVRLLSGQSVFVRMGDLTTPVCWALALGFGVFDWRRRRRLRVGAKGSAVTDTQEGEGLVGAVEA